MNDLMIYGEIGWAVTAQAAIDAIRAAPTGDLSIRINTPGGSVFEGLAIATHIRARGNVTTIIDGIAASIGSIIYLSGSRRVMAPGTLLMIHDPSSCAFGTGDDLRKEAGVLDVIAVEMAKLYADASGGRVSIEQARAMMDEETWLTAEQAVEHGWCDEIAGRATAHAKLTERTMYRNAPKEIRMDATTKEPSLLDRLVAKIGGNSEEVAKMRTDIEALTASVLDASAKVAALESERTALVEAHASALATMRADHESNISALVAEHAASLEERIKAGVAAVMTGGAPEPLTHVDPDLDIAGTATEKWNALRAQGRYEEAGKHLAANRETILKGL